MFNNEGYSLSDIAAATGSEGFGGNSAWWIIILFLFCFMGGAGNGLWGNNYNKNPASTDEVQNQFNFAALERQNNEIVDAVRQGTYDVTGAIKDGNSVLNSEFKDNVYALNTAIRDTKDVVQQNNYEIGKGFCSVNQNIDSIRYDNAINTKELLASNCSQTQKILDVLNRNRMEDMQNQINQLQLQSALCGVVRYPTTTTYSAGYAPFYSNPYGYGLGPVPTSV